MTLSDAHQKITPRHLKRNAYLYIRQSTLRQVFENTESTERQYALRQRGVALGWPLEQIIVIDRDQGLSGASMEGRDGFQRLVVDIGMGRAGIVMGLEVSRLGAATGPAPSAIATPLESSASQPSLSPSRPPSRAG